MRGLPLECPGGAAAPLPSLLSFSCPCLTFSLASPPASWPAEDTNQYGQDRRDGKGLAQLLHELGKIEGLRWMRILYAYPSYFTDDLVDEIANNPKVGGAMGCGCPGARGLAI